VIDTVGEGIERLSLRTPTLPPATETNSYLVGHGGAFYVVEPATPYRPEQRTLFERVRERIAQGESLLGAILTHHHLDHVGAAQAFRTEFGAPLLAHPRTRDRLAGTLAIDATLDEGDTLLEGTVHVLHTPGHAPGHLCLWHPRDRWLVAGDMDASVGTILNDPDDEGDMRVYLRELARLAALDPRRLLPAHGDPIDDAVARLEFYVSHRLAREAKVLAALPADGTAVDLAAIVPVAYADTPPLLWPLAGKSARAHLAKLAEDGVVLAGKGSWRRAG
jgi:glyoxylase-like metal-dependent hydrolase (beta-lactamase superfamily II)